MVCWLEGWRYLSFICFSCLVSWDSLMLKIGRWLSIVFLLSFGEARIVFTYRVIVEIIWPSTFINTSHRSWRFRFRTTRRAVLHPAPSQSVTSTYVCHGTGSQLHKSNNYSYFCSNYGVFLTRDCLAYAKIKPAVNQIEMHPYFQRDSLVKFCQKHGICVTAHTPLGGSTANTKLFGSLSCLDDPVIKVAVIPNLHY